MTSVLIFGLKYQLILKIVCTGSCPMPSNVGRQIILEILVVLRLDLSRLQGF